MTKRIVPILAVLASSLALVACGAKKDTLAASGSSQPLTLMLDWLPNADHVGIYQALASGEFKRAGLNVQLRVPSDPATPLKLLAAGKVDAAISYQPEVLLARNRGLPVVSVAAIVQKPLTSIISIDPKHGVSKPADLRGKRIGDAGIAYQHAYLQTIASRAGVRSSTIKEINVGSNLVPALLSHRVDAILGGYWNVEAIQLSQQRKRPRVIHMEQVGVPSYDELVLVMRRDTLSRRTAVARRFVQAIGRGYESARSNPQAAVNSLVQANHGLDPRLQQASVRATLSAFFPGGNRPWGWQSPTQWNAYGQWMLNNHLITDQNAVIDASTNELLAGQGP